MADVPPHPLTTLADAADTIASPPPVRRSLPDPPVNDRPVPLELDGGHPGSENPTWKVGLVLAGGGAKGGYQIGAIEALAAAGTRVHAVAGTSIGALNGAVVAGSPNLAEAAVRLVAMWERFTAAVRPATFGATMTADGKDEPLWARVVNNPSRAVALFQQRELLDRLVNEALDPGFSIRAKPFYVAAYPVSPPIPKPNEQAARYMYDLVRRISGHRSEIMCINRMPLPDARNAVLASAALPLVFPARRIETTFFRDGGLGGDNVPIRALIDEGCRVVIVVHLSQRPVLRIAEHPDLPLIEIRPRRPLQPGGPLGGLSGPLDFSPRRFALLRQHGREDASAVLGTVHAVLASATQRRAAQSAMLDGLARLNEPIRTEPPR
jgi:NTE family protein